MSDHPSPSGKLIVSREGPVTTITLNRPECHNALDRELSAELNAAVKEISVDRECRVVILRGAGDTFCAGDDIKEFNDWAARRISSGRSGSTRKPSHMIDNLVPVTIAAVDGVCTGGGLELTLVCDFVVATQPFPVGHAGDQLGHHPRLGRHREDRQVRRPPKGQGVEPHWGPVQRRGGRAS